ncbi:lipocalin family protein [Pedobacter frigiditerrae]|uniref:lipocalin family protein n=1 Tax=Pedobacter frigiditerrae TaxID=2530452 RepID=UPI00293093FC|nr:lipocalin family protein [Pedobacter frigiditerrae]
MKTKFSLSLIVLLFTLFSCTSANNNSTNEETGTTIASTGKLFLKTTMWSSGLSIEWIYLGDDGTIIFNPKYGVNPVNIAAESANNASGSGTYKIVGNTFQIKWKNGKSDSWSFEKTKGQYSAINGGIVTIPEALPANYKLNGSYSAGAITANLSSSSKLNFTPDGKFTQGSYGAVSTNETGASSSSKNSGTYTVSGHTLKLKYNSGETYVAVVGIYKISNTLTYFIINSSSYKQQ